MAIHSRMAQKRQEPVGAATLGAAAAAGMHAPQAPAPKRATRHGGRGVNPHVNSGAADLCVDSDHDAVPVSRLVHKMPRP